MIKWDYRLVRYAPDSVMIVEVGYNNNDEPIYHSPADIIGEDVAEVMEQYKLMATAFTQPVLDVNTIKQNEALNRLSNLDEELGLI